MHALVLPAIGLVAMVTRKDKYFVENGKLRYKVLDEDIFYKIESMKYCSNNWR